MTCDALDLLLTRNSHARLEGPGPCEAELTQILQAGLRAPDHGRLRPWQFLVIEGDRRQALGEAMAASLQLTDDVYAAAVEKARGAPLRAPLLIAGLLKPQANPKVPRTEQAVAVGCALHSMSLAANALGFGAVWRTGRHATDPHVLRALGAAPGDEVIGFLYIGTRQGPEKPLANLAMDEYVKRW